MFLTALRLTVEDKILYFFYCVMVAGLQGSFACFQNPAHLFVWHLIVVPECEDSPLFFRELLNGQLQFPLKQVGIEILVGLNGIGQSSFHLVHRYGGSFFPLLKKG